jgi:hypothetical protein
MAKRIGQLTEQHLYPGGYGVPSVPWDRVGFEGVSRENSGGCGSLADLEKWVFHQ